MRRTSSTLLPLLLAAACGPAGGPAAAPPPSTSANARSQSPGSPDPAPRSARPADAGGEAALASLDGASGPDIELRRIADRVWLHEGSHDLGGEWGRVDANGGIVVGRAGALLIDTAWTPAQTRWLLDRIAEATGKPALAVVATHSHGDRASGVGVALERGIPVYGHSQTAAILRAEGAPAPDHLFDDRVVIDLGDRRVGLFYPGPGHTPDNTTAHIADERLLFGGCLIRAGESDWIGNIADADVSAWPATVERLYERYPDLEVVVPGHGRVGDAALLPHTIQVARDAR